jgi:hypothetical protein
MIFNLREEIQRTKAIEYFKKCLDDGSRIELKKLFDKRSLNQNSYLHLILGWYGLEFGYTTNEAKQEYKRINRDTYIYEKKGQYYIKSSSELTTKEMTDTIEKFRNHSANEGLYIPAPNESDKIDYIKNEIEKNKQYL